MLKLPKNNPEDEEFIKRANEDPNWPDDLDKPCDWSKIPLWRKIWFVIGDGVKAIASLIVLSALCIALYEFLGGGSESFDEPYCQPSPQGCYE